MGELIRSLIVGIDPGINFGIAVLDTHGSIINLSSKRNIKRNEVVKFIARFGSPLIISSDVNPLPRTVEKIASSFGCKTFYPEKSLSVQEKHKLTKFFSRRIKNDHELDALAASIKAWQHYRELFSKMETILRERGLLSFYHKIATKLLKEESGNIIQAINETLMLEKKTTLEKEKPKIIDRALIEKLERKLIEKRKQIQKLQDEVILLSKKLSATKTKLRILQKMKFSLDKLEKIREENEKMKRFNNLLKKFELLSHKNLIPIIEINNLDTSYLEELDNFIGLKDRVILSSTTKGINLLNSFKIKTLIVKKLPEKKVLGSLEFPIVLFDTNLMHKVEDIMVVDKGKLEILLNKVRKVGLIEWLKRYRKRG